jgi:hypothetical protein
MTEQQRRDQILRARQEQMQQRAPVTAMSDAEAERIAAGGTVNLTQEQLLVTAMLGKFVQNDINGIRKAGMGDKVSDVDMSKVMPSGIAKAMGLKASGGSTPEAYPAHSVPITPIEVPITPIEVPFSISEITVPSVDIIMPPLPVQKDTQLELDFEKKARYDDINQKLEIIEDKLIAINNKVNTIIELLDKKKLNSTQTDGTQTG